MVVAVVVSMEGTLQSSLNRVADAIKKAKAMINDYEHSVVYGPRFGTSGGQITAVQYRVSNGLRCLDSASQKKLWKSPDELVLG